jgi:hypothetical protein
MVRRPHGPADTSTQDVVRRLRATGSSDPDVLYAARQELSEPFDRHRIVSLWIIIVGTLVCCTVVLAPIGVPAVLYGVGRHRRTRQNLVTIATAHAEYVATLTAAEASRAAIRRAFGA